MRRDDCHPARLGVLRWSLATPSPLLASHVRGLRFRLVARWKPPGHARACGPPLPLFRHWYKETGGSPTCPSPPAADMPRSQTPVVSSILALMHPGLLPSGACQPSAFPSIPLKDILLSTTLHLSGLNHAACLLATPGSVRPLAGRHAASLLTCGLDVRQVGFARCAHPLGNINQFHGFSPNSKVSGLPWREQTLVGQLCTPGTALRRAVIMHREFDVRSDRPGHFRPHQIDDFGHARIGVICLRRYEESCLLLPVIIPCVQPHLVRDLD